MHRNTPKRKICTMNVTLASVFAVAILFLFSPAAAFGNTVTFEGNWGEAGFNLVQQDAYGVEIVFSVPFMNIQDMMLDGERYQNVQIPGVLLPNNAGAPNLPGTGRFIAMPQGARPELEVIDYRTEIYHNMNIAPAFEIPVETDDSPLKYEKNPEIYNQNAYYPAKPVMMSEPTQMRGVDVITVGITPFQYNPVSKDLLVYKDIRVRVNFNGGNGHFGEDRLRSRWWEPVLRQNLLNYESLPEINFNRAHGTDEDNVEYIIIVPDDPNFLAWADTLKQWRNEQGIITGITTLTEIGGNNATAIENYINDAYYNWSTPPVAVLLLSDYQNSGDLYGITAPSYSYGWYSCVSDNFYADRTGNHLPDLNLARITAQNYSDLQTMIGKMLDYEREPYTDPNFYLHPLMAGGWQTERWFILACEVVYGYFDTVLGKDPVRQYAIYSGTPGSIWSSNSNTYMVVNYFGPSGLGYIPSSPSYLTNWGGNASGVNNAINSGAFLVQHRDHGSVNGWGEPSYHNSNLSGLYNNMYPYVFSTNCLTGKFNDGSECFAEAMHRMQNGALGVHAATNVSYSFVNDTFIWGMYDLMWPDFDPGYGMDPYGEENLRPGFANVSGKYYLQASSWPYNPSNKDETYYLFHHHGDAFMTLYSEIPQNLSVSHASTVSSGATNFSVTANDGSLIGISQFGSVLGSAEGTGSAVSVPITPPVPGIMRVTVTKANYYRYIADVQVTGTTPDLEVTLTPYGTPIQIPASGGSFDYNIEGSNNGSTAQVADIWCDVTLPNGSSYGPTLGPVQNFNFPGNWSTSRDRTQNVPAGAPAGTYTYNAYVGQYPSYIIDQDSFTFSKLSSDGSGGTDLDNEWTNAGEPFEGELADNHNANIPEQYLLIGSFPNPFNPTTTISFSLPEASRVHLAVYDLQGRLVAELVNGYRQAGLQEVTFDASDLASGLYLYRLEAGEFSSNGKMMLMK